MLWIVQSGSHTSQADWDQARKGHVSRAHSRSQQGLLADKWCAQYMEGTLWFLQGHGHIFIWPSNPHTAAVPGRAGQGQCHLSHWTIHTLLQPQPAPQRHCGPIISLVFIKLITIDLPGGSDESNSPYKGSVVSHQCFMPQIIWSNLAQS